MKLPYAAVRDSDRLHYTYLDTLGRPVITLRKNNLVEQHIMDFEVSTNYLMSFQYFLYYNKLYTNSQLANNVTVKWLAVLPKMSLN